MTEMKWVVGISDAESWSQLPESISFDDAPSALTWIETYLREHPAILGRSEDRGFTCKRIPIDACAIEQAAISDSPCASVTARQSLMVLADM